jgi:hypothetical protein
MSRKISGRHTRKQKKLVGGEFFGGPYSQPTCTTLQWLMGRCPPQNFGQTSCTTLQWLMGQCPQQSFTQYGGNMQMGNPQMMMMMQMLRPQVVNTNTGAFKFLDPMMKVYKLFDPATSTIRLASPQDMPVDPRMVPYPPESYPYNNEIYIKFTDPLTGIFKLFNPTTNIIMGYYPNTNSFNPVSYAQPMMGNLPPFRYGGKLNKHVLKESKTRKGGKTYRNKK